MRHYHKRKHSVGNLILNFLYYFMLISLLCIVFYPYTSFYYQKPFFMPFSNRLNASDIIIEKGDDFKLYVIGINKRVSFSSTNFKVAGVRISGMIHANRVGTTIIKAKTGRKLLKCRVRVVSLKYKSVTIKIGKKKKMKVYGNVKFVKWKSKNNKIAKINRWGKVTGLRKGTTTVTAKIKNKTLKCKIIIE